MTRKIDNEKKVEHLAIIILAINCITLGLLLGRLIDEIAKNMVMP